ncbi:putative c6 zinc finger domain containing protein [Daldinia childiae]|uniref:putative c6 zinc finger domain containing protein n=1 Tax=Daldinia childiae TaxID=326645 RepID=UPI001445DA19|nr:putative c6 zinc finger domain containing protein [Daldinia childiae]KAF3066447.1 putative c6 zinc finger domain containing protein [Daldinia childiae]
MAANYQTNAAHFTNTFSSEQPAISERTGSRDYSHTDEWVLSILTPTPPPPRRLQNTPSRFQKRKGSIYATPSSRDGHVERNRDAVEEFHKAHSKRWSMSSNGSSRRGSLPGNSNNTNTNTTTNTTSTSDQRRKASQ